jgi:hypothetical protein
MTYHILTFLADIVRLKRRGGGNQCEDVSGTSSYTTDLDCVILEAISIVPG